MTYLFTKLKMDRKFLNLNKKNKQANYAAQNTTPLEKLFLFPSMVILYNAEKVNSTA